jgi:GNAT superfamily N-acetyltransferase
MSDALVDPADLDATDDKAREALAGYRMVRIEGAADPGFDGVWSALRDEFAPRGEIERTAVAKQWLSWGERELDDGLAWRYHLLGAYDEHGKLAGARDCHTSVDAAAGLCVVYLAHTLVLPAHRRRGLAALLRAAPITLGRRALVDAAIAGADVLLAAEMEPFVAADDDTRIRLVSYGRAGFGVIPPEVLPYCQPDFRDLGSDQPPKPLPLLPVVRWLAHEGEGRLPRTHCAAFLQHLYAIFATHCSAGQLAELKQHALTALRDAPASVTLLPLPTSMDDGARLEPLSRARVLAHHLPHLR